MCGTNKTKHAFLSHVVLSSEIWNSDGYVNEGY